MCILKVYRQGLEQWLTGYEHWSFFQRTEFNAQYPHGGSQEYVIAVLEDSTVLSMHTVHRHTGRQNTGHIKQ